MLSFITMCAFPSNIILFSPAFEFIKAHTAHTSSFLSHWVCAICHVGSCGHFHSGENNARGLSCNSWPSLPLVDVWIAFTLGQLHSYTSAWCSCAGPSLRHTPKSRVSMFAPVQWLWTMFMIYIKLFSKVIVSIILPLFHIFINHWYYHTLKFLPI